MYQATKDFLDDVQPKFNVIDRQIGEVRKAISKLNEKMGQVGIYGEKVAREKAVSRLELEELEAQLKQLRTKRREMVRQTMLPSDYLDRIFAAGLEAHLNDAILKPMEDHVQAINGLLRKARQSDKEVSNDMREEVNQIAPYLDSVQSVMQQVDFRSNKNQVNDVLSQLDKY